MEAAKGNSLKVVRPAGAGAGLSADAPAANARVPPALWARGHPPTRAGPASPRDVFLPMSQLPEGRKAALHFRNSSFRSN